MAKKKGKNANYNFADQIDPSRPMGGGSYSNLPQEPIYKTFGSYSYRDGIIDSFTEGLKKVSGIDENQR